MSGTRRSPGTYSAPLFSRFLYPRFADNALAHGEAEHRRRLLTGVSGRVIEVGAGDGRSFDYYPDSVEEVVAVEPEDRLREQAAERARRASVPVRVEPGFAGDLPAPDGSFDTAIASLVLCSVPDQSAALAEIRRVLKPGGELRFYEHVRSPKRMVAGIQSAVTPVWSRLGGGCHLNRDTESAIAAAGFEIERREGFLFAPGLLDRIGNPHILGVARRPSTEAT